MSLVSEEQPPFLASVLAREKTTWIRNGFAKFEHTDGSGTTFEHLEDRQVLIGPHRFGVSFYLAKPNESVNMLRRASVAKLESTIEREKTADVPMESEQDGSGHSLKEALIKNPSVIQMLNSSNTKPSSHHRVVFHFKDAADFCYFKFPGITAVGKIDLSTRLICQIKRTVNEVEYERSVHLIIRDASDRLHELLLESCKDPFKLSADCQATGRPVTVYKESCIGFKPPAQLDDTFWPAQAEYPAETAPSGSSVKKAKPAAKPSAPAPKPTPDPNLSSKQCAHCGIKGTPQWRRGPDGAGTLCNACGVKWKHGKLSSKQPSSKKSPPSESKDEIDVVGKKERPSQSTSSSTASDTVKPAAKESFIPLKKRKFMQSSYNSARQSSSEDVASSTAEKPIEQSDNQTPDLK